MCELPGLVQLFGGAFSEVEVLLDLFQFGGFTGDLFAETQLEASQMVMAVPDAASAKLGWQSIYSPSAVDVRWRVRRYEPRPLP